MRLAFPSGFRLRFAQGLRRALLLAHRGAFARSPCGFAIYFVQRLLQCDVPLPSPCLTIDNRIGLGQQREMVTDAGGHASSAPNSPRAAPAGLRDAVHCIVSAIFSAAIRAGKLPVFPQQADIFNIAR